MSHRPLTPDQLPVPPPIPLVARIENGLLDYKITLRMSASRTSETIFVKPEWRKPDKPRLYYLYRQREEGHVPVTDTAEHMGAAWLDYDAHSDRLNGSYWTGRKAEVGHQHGRVDQVVAEKAKFGREARTRP